MSHDHDMNVTQMHWQPPLVKLTQVANPDHDEGKPTTCFINAQNITQINRAISSFSKINADGTVPSSTDKREFHPAQACTVVMVGASQGLQVTESPETVAMLRDRALGHEPPKPMKVDVDDLLKNVPK